MAEFFCRTCGNVLHETPFCHGAMQCVDAEKLQAVRVELKQLRRERDKLRNALQCCCDIAIGKHHMIPFDRTAAIESVVKKALEE
jgi:hypothetical protein